MIRSGPSRRRRALLNCCANMERKHYLAAAENITFGFYWNKSKEGHEFWLRIRKALICEAYRQMIDKQCV